VLKAVVFDFYGTLAETRDWGPSFADMVLEMGYDLPDDVRDRWWNDGIDGTEHDEHSVSRDTYVAWQQSRVRMMLDGCGVSAAHQEEMIERVREIGAHSRISAYDEVPAVLDALRASGVLLAICSNWDWDLHEAVESAGLHDAFDVTISSAWVGARKPHPRIYAHTLEQIGIAPEHTLFVGDTWACDVEGPRAAGMQSLYVRRPHVGPDTTAPATPDLPPVPDLTRLPERVT
jgi:putative hydrolase of the HAD superfamily